MLRVVLLMLTFCGLSAVAQNSDSIRPPRFTLYDFYAGAGRFTTPVWAASQEKFKSHIPSSRLMNGDLMEVRSGMFVNQPVFMDTQGVVNRAFPRHTFVFHAGATWKIRDSEDGESQRPWLRTGILYRSSHTMFAGEFFKSSTDTLVRGNYQRDSMSFRSLRYEVSGKNIMLEAALLFRFREEGIFSAYAGLGMIAGVGFERVATVASSTVTQIEEMVETSYGRAMIHSQQNQVVERETFKTGVAPAMGVQAILGAELRLAQNYKILQQTRFYAEFRPVFATQYVKGLGSHTAISAAITGGFIYRLK
jgi:hypothetical protein